MTIKHAPMSASHRGSTLPVSPIRRLAPLAEAARLCGTQVIHLNIGQPDLDPPPSVVEALRHAASDRLVYAPSRGLPETVEAWVAYYRHHGIELETSDVLVTGGASEALWLALLVTCDPGDRVLIPEPFFAPYTGLAAIAGLETVGVPLSPGFAPPSVDAIRERLTSRTRAILICSPNNPTGTVYSRDDLEQIGALARERGLFIISDETYREIVFDGPAAPSALSLPGVEEQVVVVDSVSKRFNACGLRIGSLVSRNAEIMAAVLDIAELRLAIPVVDQHAIMGALMAPEPYVASIVATYKERTRIVAEGLAGIPGVECRQPAGAFYVVARLPVEDAEAFAAWLLRDFAFDGETVMLTPMSDFYATPGLGRDEVRLACVHDAATLIRAVEILRAGLASYPDCETNSQK